MKPAKKPSNNRTVVVSLRELESGREVSVYGFFNEFSRDWRLFDSGRLSHDSHIAPELYGEDFEEWEVISWQEVPEGSRVSSVVYSNYRSSESA